MARETKLGLGLVLILMSVFSVLVYKRMVNPLAAVAAETVAENSENEAPEGEHPPAEDPLPILSVPNKDAAPSEIIRTAGVSQEDAISGAASNSSKPAAANGPVDPFDGVGEKMESPLPIAQKSSPPAAAPSLPTFVDDSDPFTATKSSSTDFGDPTPALKEPTGAMTATSSEDPFSVSSDDAPGMVAVETAPAATSEVDPFAAPSDTGLANSMENSSAGTMAAPAQMNNDDADPFGTASADEVADFSAEGAGAPKTAVAAPKLPTPVEDFGNQFEPVPKQAQTETVETEPATTATPAEAFDPFSGSEEPQQTAPAATATKEPADDPFATGQPAMTFEEQSPPMQSAEQDPFGSDPAPAQPAVTSSPTSLPTDNDSADDPFGSSAPAMKAVDQEAVARPAAKPVGSLGFEDFSAGNSSEAMPAEDAAPAQPDPFGEPEPSEQASTPALVAEPARSIPEDPFPAADVNADPFGTPPARSVPAANVPKPGVTRFPAAPDAITFEAPTEIPDDSGAPATLQSMPADDGNSPVGQAFDAANKGFDEQPRPASVASFPEARAIRPTASAPTRLGGLSNETTAELRRPDSPHYQIQPGDNFWEISKKVYGTGRYWQALRAHNADKIPDPNRMKLGMMVSTPQPEELAAQYAHAIPKAAVPEVAFQPSTAISEGNPLEPSGFFVDQDGVPVYRVGPEDTLSGIAQRHLGRSSRWVQIFEMNRGLLKDGNNLTIGLVLRLPADASQVQLVSDSPSNRR